MRCRRELGPPPPACAPLCSLTLQGRGSRAASHAPLPLGSGWRQNGDVHGNPFRGLPPDPLHREDNGVWLTFIDAFCAALKAQFPTTRRKRARGADAEAEEESHSDKIDEVNERLAKLAIEGRWESFNIPSQGEYLPEHTDAQVSPLSRRGSRNHRTQLTFSAD